MLSLAARQQSATELRFHAADKDTTVPPALVEAMYDVAPGVEKSFAEVNGSSHTDATGWADRPVGCKPAPLGCAHT